MVDVTPSAADLYQLESEYALLTGHGLRMDEANMRAIDGIRFREAVLPAHRTVRSAGRIAHSLVMLSPTHA